jgi:molybdopterin/thiamine biosynthesis adenylyltransferase
MERYIRNSPALTQTENEMLGGRKVCVAGCGGLGGYIIEILGRLGVGNMTVVDGDVFQESNLNRQILSDTNSIGKNKALSAVERMKKVNPTINVTPITQMMSLENSKKIIYGHDLVMDALDTIESKLILQDICDKLNIPMIHGAASGWFGQIASIFPGDKTLNKIYTSFEIDSISLGTPSFSPALTASIQCSEAVKVLINRGEIVRNGFLFIDILNNTFQIIKL